MGALTGCLALIIVVVPSLVGVSAQLANAETLSGRQACQLTQYVFPRVQFPVTRRMRVLAAKVRALDSRIGKLQIRLSHLNPKSPISQRTEKQIRDLKVTFSKVRAEQDRETENARRTSGPMVFRLI